MGPSRIITVTLNTAVDRVVVDGREVARYPAGKAINVSRTLAALGMPSVAMGFVGTDEVAAFAAFLGAPGCIESRLVPVPGPTRINTTTLDLGARRESHVRTEGFSVKPDDVAALATMLESAATPDATIVFSGSAPPGMRSDDLRALVRLCSARGARAAVDASGEALAAMCAEPLWLLKINAEELGALTGMPTATQAQVIGAARSVSGVSEHVCITRGADGAILITPRETMVARARVDQARVVSTVGSGDALLGGLLHALDSGGTWADALRMGVACASARATTAAPGIINPCQVTLYMDAVAVEGVETP